MNRDRKIINPENRGKMRDGDERWMREEAGRRYRTAFVTQSTSNLASEAIYMKGPFLGHLMEWPISGTAHQMAQFWAHPSQPGPFLGFIASSPLQSSFA
jgi:hypothetical protein